MIDDEQVQPELLLQGFTYYERAALLPCLGTAIDGAGGWLLDRRPISATTTEIHLEVQYRGLPEIYAALLSTGIELTRESHRALAERCNCCLQLPALRGAASILSLRLDLHFLAEPAGNGDASFSMLMTVASA